jgi:hypothetical protein
MRLRQCIDAAVAAAFYEEALICALLAFALAFNTQVREKDKGEGK